MAILLIRCRRYGACSSVRVGYCGKVLRPAKRWRTPMNLVDANKPDAHFEVHVVGHPTCPSCAACVLGLEGSCFLSWLHGQQKCRFRGDFHRRGLLRPKRTPEMAVCRRQNPKTAGGWGNISRTHRKSPRNRPKRRMSLPWDTYVDMEVGGL